MIAYKFTEKNRRPRYGRDDYPVVGEWSEKRKPVLCKSGWHVPVLLSEWIMAELWKVEVKGQSVGDGTKIAYEQIKFIERVDDWGIPAMRDFVEHCCNRRWRVYAATTTAAADDAAYATTAAYADDAAAYASRRRYQHNWIVGRLNLGREMEVVE